MRAVYMDVNWGITEYKTTTMPWTKKQNKTTPLKKRVKFSYKTR